MSIDETETVSLTPAGAIKALGLTIESVFIPWSKSRNFKPDSKTVRDRSLNWKVTLKRNGRDVLTCDYSAGIGHLKGKGAPDRKGGGYSYGIAYTIEQETEIGFPFLNSYRMDRKNPYKPEAASVIHSLICDASALDHPSFESWAIDCGYDPDSRKAESIYQACLEIGLKMRAALGDAGLKTLQTAFQDY